eukprot:Gregarina_sp_Pseudo_9__547@NODE_1352_length_1668_cov_33_802333_g1263_i0_p1_GENE_NODE_1352_length_1668_cov_33_802333_g1263_i0NODE_1352_length_1668_cov_33_802333_g1263_i0_p1_ORF_typecomplete_len389_score66_26_NODE_1352_length_1668_cov_33_802333_g1263_i03771543
MPNRSVEGQQLNQNAGVQTEEDELAAAAGRDPAFFYVDQYPSSFVKQMQPVSHVHNESHSLCAEKATCEGDTVVSPECDIESISDTSSSAEVSVSTDQLEEHTGSTTARIIEDVFRERRRQVKLQSLEDVVILLSIPRFKTNGQLNHRWNSCQLVSADYDGPRAMIKQLEDPMTGDVIFSFARRPVCSNQGLNDGTRPHMNFALKCCCCGDEDRPSVSEFYSVPVDRPEVFSLRDGALTKGDRVFDTGIILALDLPEHGAGVPLLHYFDEVSGVWAAKPFARTRHDKCVCVLAAARRTEFVIQEGPNKYIKNKQGQNFRVHWPGCYELKGEAIEPLDYITLSKSFISQIQRYPSKESPVSLKGIHHPKPATFAICKFASDSVPLQMEL